MVGMTRAHIADPHMVQEADEGRDRRHPAMRRRQLLHRPHLCRRRRALHAERRHRPRSDHAARHPQGRPTAKRVVVVGGGPGGLEAARVCAERGHEVVLFEKMPTPSAARSTSPPRRHGASAGRHRPLARQGRRPSLGVDVRLGTEADAGDDRWREKPDIVVLATGGSPNPRPRQGLPSLAVTTWDILPARSSPPRTCSSTTDRPAHTRPSTADFLAKRGARSRSSPPTARSPTRSAPPTPIHLRELYKLGVVMTPNTGSTEIYREGNKLIAVLAQRIYRRRGGARGRPGRDRVRHPAQRRALLGPEGKTRSIAARPTSHALVDGQPQPRERNGRRSATSSLPRRRRRRRPQHPRRDLRRAAPLQGPLRPMLGFHALPRSSSYLAGGAPWRWRSFRRIGSGAMAAARRCRSGSRACWRCRALSGRRPPRRRARPLHLAASTSLWPAAFLAALALIALAGSPAALPALARSGWPARLALPVMLAGS